jgi:hypothetical protein
MYPEVLNGLEFLGLYVHEPGGLISNLLIALSCLVISLQHRDVRTPFQKDWVLFVICIGLGATGGSLVHGFSTYLGRDGFYYTWAVKNSFVPLANFFALRAMARPGFRNLRSLNLILGFKALSIIFLLFFLYSFLPAVVDLAITYVLVIALAWKFRQKVPAYRYFLTAFLVALFSGGFYLFKMEFLNGFFTEKDLVHLFVILSLFIIHKGISFAKGDGTNLGA